ncbi:hypothetical protein WA016_01367 [Myxococcus stipitatus]
MRFVATTGALTGELVRDLMAETLEYRFGAGSRVTPHPIEWLTDNGPSNPARLRARVEPRPAHPEGRLHMSAKALTARAETWRPWRAYAVIHLWQDSMGPAKATSMLNRTPPKSAPSRKGKGTVSCKAT